MHTTRGKSPVVYLLYAFVLFFFLIVFLFPYRRFAETLIGHFEEKLGVELAYQELEYAFPCTCRLKNVEIFLPLENGRISAYRGKRLSLTFRPAPLLKKRIGFHIQGEGYGGKVSGDAVLAFLSHPGSGNYRFKVRGVRIEDVLSPFYLRNFKLRGMLDGDADWHLTERGDGYGAGGSLSLLLRNGAVRNILIRGLDLPDFSFKKIQVISRLSAGTLHVEICRVDSEIFLAEISGDIRISVRDIRDSELALSARLKSRPGDPINLHGVAAFFGKKLDPDGYYPFRFSGTIRFPEIR